MDTKPTEAIIRRTTRFADGPTYWNMKVQPELDGQVVRQCKKLRVSKSDYIRCAVRERLENG